MSGGGGTTTQYVKSEQSSLPEYARPYFEGLMQRAGTTLTQDYTPYGQERIAGFTPQQRAIQQQVAGLQTPSQFQAGSQLAQAAGLGSIAAGQYTPGSFNTAQAAASYAPTDFSAQGVSPGQYSAATYGAERITPGTYNAPGMATAQTGYNPNLQYFQMQGPGTFTQPGAANRYMSPYIQEALEPQMREAVRSARRGQIVEDLGAARQGTYGGSRQLLAGLERERNLGMQLGDIQARGMQTAYEQAQQQFNTEQAARQQAQQANLQARLGVQQLGTQTGLQAALANLDAASQANVQNLAAQLQTQGLNANQALQAALANQQSGLEAQRLTDLSAQFGAGQQFQANLANQQANLEAQRLGDVSRQFAGQQQMQASLANQQAQMDAQRLAEQSRQFGAQQGLAGLAQAGQMAQTLGNLGQYQQQADLSRLGMQQSTAAQQQALQQQGLDIAYRDFLRQRDYPMEELQQYSSLLRGVPVTPSTTQAAYAPQPGIAQQLLGTGLGAASIYKTFAGV